MSNPKKIKEESAKIEAVANDAAFAELDKTLTDGKARGLLKFRVAIRDKYRPYDLASGIEPGAQDEVGRMMNGLKEVNDSLLSLVSNAHSSVHVVASTAQEIAVGNMQLNDRMLDHAQTLQGTTASNIAAKGGEVEAQVFTTMGTINASSEKIADTIGVIDCIAFQTNILVLNTAVGAARAGEQGLGFAVVASKVRRLAQRSATVAKEIKTLIDRSAANVDAGSRLVGHTGSTMTELTAADQEQTAGIERVNESITRINEVTQQNAAMVEEADAAEQTLHSEADSLSSAISVFKLGDAGDLQELRTVQAIGHGG